MKKLFLLSKQNLDLAKEEVLSLTNADYELIENLLIVDTNLKLEKRLGYTHAIYKFLFKCYINDFTKTVKRYDWQKIYKKNFCVRIHNSKYEEKEIASIIWHSLKNPKVNLTTPKTKIEFFFHNNTVVATLFENNIDKSFLKRKAHLRPSLHPTSLHPGLARVIINLTGLHKGTILDPFCGSGGILIEAGLMGFNVIGYDIDDAQINRAKKNLDFYKVKYNLETRDALTLEKTDVIVTDLPYGKASKGENIEKLFEVFLKKAYSKTKIIIVVIPNYIKMPKSRWKIRNKFEVYIHKSLTRVILKLVPH